MTTGNDSLANFRPVTDVHVHIQPWEQLLPEVAASMRRGKEAVWDRLKAVMDDPKVLLAMLDEAGIERIALINYPSPDLMGFDETANEFSARYASAAPARLLPFGGVHPRFTKDAKGDVDQAVDLGVRCLKIHPPHQLFAANAYTEGLETLGTIYRRCEERGLPVMIHTGTSIFPKARSKWGRPMAIDDVAIDFPDLKIVMAHGGRPLWMDEAFFVLRRHPNVWLDVSGIPPARLLDYFPRLSEIADRALWGTDWPSPGVRDMRANLDVFLGLPLDESVKRKIVSANSLVLFPVES